MKTSRLHAAALRARRVATLGIAAVTALVPTAFAEPTLQRAEWSGQVLTPLEVLYLDGAGRVVQDWTPVGGIAEQVECNGGLAFDAAQVDAETGAPIGGECLAGGTADSRYGFGPGYFMYNGAGPFRVTAEAAGQPIGWLTTFVSWRPPQPENLYVLFQMYDTFSSDCTPPFATGGIWQAAYYFGTVAARTDYYVLSMAVCNAPPGINFPADGDGAFRFLYAQWINLSPPMTYTPPSAAGPIVWGFRADEPHRAGHPADPNNPPSNRVWWDHRSFSLDGCASNTPDGVFDAPPGCDCFLLPHLGAIPGYAGCNFIDTEAAWTFWRRGFPDRCVGFIRGDSNCDGLVNNFDIDPFVLALVAPSGPDGYPEQYPNCDLVCNNDTNGDGLVNGFDIDPFVELLAGG